MDVRGLVWVGTRTRAFAPTVEFFRRVLDLPLGYSRPHFVRLDLPDGGFVEVFDSASGEYPHFSTGPVVGFQVGDFDRAREQLERGGCDLLRAPGGDNGGYRWQHFRAPDGCVYEIVDYPHRPAPAPPVGAMAVSKLCWVGSSVPDFGAAEEFLTATLGLPVQEATSDLIECRLPDGGSVEAFRRDGPRDHPHFRTGPVPGFRVAHLDGALERLRRSGVPLIESHRRAAGGWAHFRAPDGCVYEVQEFPDASGT